MTSLVALALFAAVTSATLVAAPDSPGEGCPNARQVTEALQSRLPNSIVPANEQLWPAQGDILRSVLEVAADGTLVRFSLVNARGDAQLRRTLSVASQGRSGECQALAETLAAIVERFLNFKGYDSSTPGGGAPDDIGGFGTRGAAPPAVVSANSQDPDPSRPENRRSIRVFLGGAVHTNMASSAGDPEFEARVGGQFEPSARHLHFGVIASAGVATERRLDWTDGNTARLRRYPLRIGATAALRAGRGWLEPRVELGVDLLTATTRVTEYRGIVTANGALAYRVDLWKRLFVRALAGGGVALLRYDVSLAGEAAHFQTSRTYIDAGIETGLCF